MRNCGNLGESQVFQAGYRGNHDFLTYTAKEY